MSEEAFAKMVLDAQLKQDQNEEITERLLCSPRIESRVKELRTLAGRNKTNVNHQSPRSVQSLVARKGCFSQLLFGPEAQGNSKLEV